jgi:hypothetical protein
MINHNATFENFDKNIRIDAVERSCGDCTYCCDGWLRCNIFGYEVGKGVPCKFVIKGKGCGAYDYRPYDPCKTFKCYYRQDRSVPDKFKPSLVGNIVIARVIKDIPFIDIVEAGSSLNLELLHWVLQLYRDGKVDSVRYFLDGEANWVTRDPDFEKAMREEQRRIIAIIEEKKK